MTQTRLDSSRVGSALADPMTDIVLEGLGTWDPPTSRLDENGQGIPYATYGFAAQMAEVEVDTVLGTVKVLEIVAAHDVGRAINPTLVEGQIHGGIAQGLGLALMEEFIPGRTENLHDYLIPTVGDMPPRQDLPDRGPRAARPLRRQGRRRAGADRHRAGHPLRHPPRHRRAHHPRAGPAAPPVGSAAERGHDMLHPHSARRGPATRQGRDRRVAELRSMSTDQLSLAARSKKFGAAEGEGIVRCDACPVLCRIRPGRAGPARAMPTRTAARAHRSGRPDAAHAGRGRQAHARSPAPSGTARRSIPRARSSRASAPAPPIPTTSRPPSSSRPSTTASTPSPSSPRASSATAASR